MIIKSVRVSNFRCIRDETLECDGLIALVGPNGSGKSTFLKALNKFYEPGAKFVKEDFYGNETKEPIIISVTFNDLSPPEKEMMRSHMNGDELVVEKEVTFANKPVQKYYSYSLLNPDFKTYRS
jgi:putative ATP-dependent endonuclease of OLD family